MNLVYSINCSIFSSGHCLVLMMLIHQISSKLSVHLLQINFLKKQCQKDKKNQTACIDCGFTCRPKWKCNDDFRNHSL